LWFQSRTSEDRGQNRDLHQIVAVIDPRQDLDLRTRAETTTTITKEDAGTAPFKIKEDTAPQDTIEHQITTKDTKVGKISNFKIADRKANKFNKGVIGRTILIATRQEIDANNNLWSPTGCIFHSFISIYFHVFQSILVLINKRAE
jgi:hypothetical protein